MLPSVQEAKEQEFEQLTQGEMIISQYDAQYTRLSHYVEHLIPNEKAKVERFVYGLQNYFFDRVIVTKSTTYQQAQNQAI